MTRTAARGLVLLGLGLALAACAQHRPARANCFNFREPAPAAAATTVLSTMGAGEARRDTGCTFVMLGAGD